MGRTYAHTGFDYSYHEGLGLTSRKYLLSFYRLAEVHHIHHRPATPRSYYLAPIYTHPDRFLQSKQRNTYSER